MRSLSTNMPWTGYLLLFLNFIGENSHGHWLHIGYNGIADTFREGAAHSGWDTPTNWAHLTSLNWVFSVFDICGWEEGSFPVYSKAKFWKKKRTRYCVMSPGPYDFGQNAQYLNIHLEAVDTYWYQHGIGTGDAKWWSLPAFKELEFSQFPSTFIAL